VIVAHSHGAQWLWKTLSVWRWHGFEPPIKGALFAYLHPLHISPKLAPKDSQRFFTALGSIFTISTVVVLKSFWHTWWFLFTAFFLCQFLFTAIIVALSSLPRMKSAPYYVPLIRSDIPTFIWRATRTRLHSPSVLLSRSMHCFVECTALFDEPLWTNPANWLSKLIAFLAFYELGTIALNSVFDAREYAEFVRLSEGCS